jgi:hypothetical protein
MHASPSIDLVQKLIEKLSAALFVNFKARHELDQILVAEQLARYSPQELARITGLGQNQERPSMAVNEYVPEFLKELKEDVIDSIRVIGQDVTRLKDKSVIDDVDDFVEAASQIVDHPEASRKRQEIFEKATRALKEMEDTYVRELVYLQNTDTSGALTQYQIFRERLSNALVYGVVKEQMAQIFCHLDSRFLRVLFLRGNDALRSGFLTRYTGENQERCPICYGNPVDPVALPCNHIFCNRCIQEWLNVRPICPRCTRTFTTGSGSM